ncbi:type II toxin-antitoxin system RelB/DinJ family antitoxin [Sphingomonas sp.]|jgi:DNA-damage-inducible protein J|uniref:type II toxin-antitoxin system RelB/DinJ family antitoxin n=1 Tax=Sphingomonas sp. TaxID=28214 RepID=UPI00289C903B|nr:type II toxin-antitoxin system RelB/DinJ family antitoxin [Sphingomonas sp.]
MAAAEIVRARIDSDLKKEASAVLSGMGLSVSDAIRLLFVRVAAEKAMPFDLRVPNTETQAAMRDVREGRVTRVSNVSALMADLDADD